MTLALPDLQPRIPRVGERRGSSQDEPDDEGVAAMNRKAAGRATGLMSLGAAYLALIKWVPSIAFWIFIAGMVMVLWIGLYVMLDDLELDR